MTFLEPVPPPVFSFVCSFLDTSVVIDEHRDDDDDVCHFLRRKRRMLQNMGMQGE